MIKLFAQKNDRLYEISEAEAGTSLVPVWIDLLNPTLPEEQLVEKLVKINIPTRDELREIEISSTLYQENGAAFMTASLVTQSDTLDPQLHPVSFILTGNTLITLRYAEPKAFELYINKVKTGQTAYESPAILIELLETITGRVADSLEKAARSIEDTTRLIFRPLPDPADKKTKQPAVNFQSVLHQIGSIGNLISKISETLVSLARLTSYVTQTPPYHNKPESIHHLDIIFKDVLSLRDHTNSLSTKVSFLLDATLGMINIEQNAIIKIFSVASVIFLPPTLIASIYGMNFLHIPELEWPFGYPMAIAIMTLSAFLPYRFFKKKGWL